MAKTSKNADIMSQAFRYVAPWDVPCLENKSETETQNKELAYLLVKCNK